jgi:galactose mutarotase-like enzyme
MNTHQLRWSHGEATVATTAATVIDATFNLPNGPFKPFARAPWIGSVTDTSIAGHLRVLSGDFVGLPFGNGGRTAPNLPEWSELLTQKPTGTIHGPAAHYDWTIVEGDEKSVTLALDYEPHSAVRRVERIITARDGSPALDFELRIHARYKGAISAGLHPNFRFPEKAGRLELKIGFQFGLTHPGQTAAGDPQEFSDLASVPKDGGRVDMSHLPLSPRTDKNVQLCGVTTPITGTYLDEGMGFELDWDRSLLPTLMMWHTDGGIHGEPWNGEFRGLGLEPLASAFDFHNDVSCGPNPINKRGVRTSIDIDPAAPVVIKHSIRGFAV